MRETKQEGKKEKEIEKAGMREGERDNERKEQRMRIIFMGRRYHHDEPAWRPTNGVTACRWCHGTRTSRAARFAPWTIMSIIIARERRGEQRLALTLLTSLIYTFRYVFSGLSLFLLSSLDACAHFIGGDWVMRAIFPR